MPRKITGTINRTYDLESSMSINEKTYNKQSYLNTWFKMAEDISSSGDLISSIRGVALTPSNDAGFRRPPYTTSNIPDRLNGVTALSLDSSYVFPTGASGSEVVLEQKSGAVDEFSYGHNPPGSSNAFTFGFWIRFYNTNVDRTVLSKWHDSNTSQQQYQIRINGGQERIQFRVFHGPSSRIYQIQSSAQLSAARWYHISFTFSGNASQADSFKIYIDGKLDKSDRLRDSGNNPYPDGSIFNKPSFFAIGNDYVNAVPGNALEATMSELAIWTTELSADDLFVIYNMLSLDDSTKSRSGYVNLPPRIEIRNRDNATGSYPTILRMGDKDRRGSYSTQFDDTNTIAFGRRINDNFELTDKIKVGGVMNYSKTINSKLWTHSTDMEIRRETFVNVGGGTALDGALVFAGPGDADGRWIQTREKIKNPILEMDVIQGPYNQSRTALGAGLGLENPGSSVLKVQASLDGSSWEDIKEIPNNAEGLFLISAFSSRTQFEELLRKRKRVSIKISIQEFSIMKGGAFYLRIIEEAASISDPSIASWAIGKINIDYHNEEVNYPLMIDAASRVGQRVASGAIATPHTLPTLTAPGRSISGISDIHLKFTPGEDISAFDDSRILTIAESQFFTQGTDPDEIPGFSSPLWSKTQINFEISASNRLTIGSADVASSVKRDFMCYFNHENNIWEVDPLKGINRNALTSDSSDEDIKKLIYSGCIGFGPNSTLSKSGSIYDLSLLERSNSHVTTWGFPTDLKYSPKTGQTIKASDLGITRPFLLEKCQIRFNADINLPFETGAATERRGYNLRHIAEPSAIVNVTSDDYAIVAPTFFMLRNYKTKVEKSYSVLSYDNDNNYDHNTEINITIPGTVMSGASEPSHVERYADDTRDLITYGQLSIIYSGSGGDSYAGTRDERVFVNNDTGANTGLTGSFKINFPCRKQDNFSGGSIYQSGDYGLYLENQGPRGVLDFDGGARSISNIFSKRKIKKTIDEYPVVYSYDPAAQARAIDGVKVYEKLSEYSPYLIFPEDEIILGWQFPIPDQLIGLGGTTSSAVYTQMSLYGITNITLFGSQVKEGKEFHEPVNQNIGSNSVHEMIGSETVTDQFDLALSGEYTGSFFDTAISAVSNEPLVRIGAKTYSKLSISDRDDKDDILGVTAATSTLLVPVFAGMTGISDGDKFTITDYEGTQCSFYAWSNPNGPTDGSPHSPQLKKDVATPSPWTSWNSGSWADSPVDKLLSNTVRQLGYGGGTGKYQSLFGLDWDPLTNPPAPEDISGFTNNDYAFKLDSSGEGGTVTSRSGLKSTFRALVDAIIESPLKITGSVTDIGTPPFISSTIFSLKQLALGVRGNNREVTYTNSDDVYADDHVAIGSARTFNLPDFSGGTTAEKVSFTKTSSTRDAERVYVDSLLKNENVGYSNSSFGTMQTDGSPIRPKYYLSSRKFGQAVDFIEQGRDSKTRQDLAVKRSGLIVSRKGGALKEPVSVTFVSGSDENNTGARSFKRISPDDAVNSVNKTLNSALTGAFYDPA